MFNKLIALVVAVVVYLLLATTYLRSAQLDYVLGSGYVLIESDEICIPYRNLGQDFKTKEIIINNEFLSRIYNIALRVEAEYGVPRAATLAMAAYESGYGKSYLARKGFNFFGMKAFRDWKGKRILNPLDGIYYRKYDSVEAGIIGYAEFLQKTHYRPAFIHKNNPKAFIAKILQCGYCPDSFYMKDIKRIFSRHDLDKI